MKNREKEYIKDNEVFINEYEQKPIYKDSDASEEVFRAHSMHIETLEQAENKAKQDYKGEKKTGRIISVGKTKSGKIWVYFQIIGSKELIVKSYTPEHFLSLLHNINGIYSVLIKDEEGFPICEDITLTQEELTDRLRGNRICFIDDKPIKICA